MKANRLFTFALCLSSAGLVGQTVIQTGTNNYVSGSQRSFALVVGSSMLTLNGDWHQMPPLTRYAHDHPGSYLVFLQGGSLYRLDAPKQVAEAERVYSPMIALAAQQRALAAAQQPLGREQQALAKQQQGTANPADKGRIGAAQGAIGEQQGLLGQQQGALGREQGEIGKAFYNHVQAMLDACLTDGTCPRVATGTALP